MSSPTKYRSTYSPIRNIEDKYSPSRNLDTILEESVSSKRSLRQSVQQYEKEKYKSKYSLPSPTYNASYTDTKKLLLVQNNRLQNDNQILASSNNYTSVAYQKQLDLKDAQLETLRRQLNLTQERFEKENQTLRIQNQSLRKNLVLLESKRAQQISALRLKYSAIPSQNRQQLRKFFQNDITKALMDLETAHAILNQKEKQMEHLTLLLRKNSQQYALNIEELISENNSLKNKLVQFEITTQKEIRQITARKQLQKSRTQGIISYCKQNTLYIEKQISRLAEELLKKNISIESFNREVTKYQKLIQEQGKRHDDQNHRLKKEYEIIINDKQNNFLKLQKQFKLDLAEKKKIQLELIQKISSAQNQLQTQYKKLDFANQTIQDKEKVIRQLKDSIQRKEDDHAKQISKVMSDSRVKRKSVKNLSSYSSFKDIEEGQGSSIIKSGHLKRQSSILQEGNLGILPTVREQQNLTKSQGFAMGEEDQLELKQLIIHYESLIQQLKRNKITELTIANNKIESLKQSLNEKQQQILDILNRFSPLMEYKMNKQSIDEQRKRKIEEHQKGDIDLLGVLLQKYDIVSLRKR